MLAAGGAEKGRVFEEAGRGGSTEEGRGGAEGRIAGAGDDEGVPILGPSALGQ